MSRLLVFNDLITALQQPPAAMGEQCESVLAIGSATATASAANARADRSPDVANQVADVIKLSDVAALLPRREFRIHIGQISDSDSNASYSALCWQMDEGLAEGFTEAEVICTVLKIKPGTFRHTDDQA